MEAWAVLVSLAVLFLARVYWVLKSTGKPLPRAATKRALRTLIVLGSGGHTAEMLSLVGALNLDKYVPRYYIAAATDDMSLSRAQRVEERAQQEHSVAEAGVQQGTQYLQVYRSREVGQSYITSVGTTIWAMVHALWLVSRIQPDVILCNGPGTCLPICMVGFLLKVLGVRWVVMVYVESIARVKKLSLTGLLLYKLGVADQLFVQWPQLENKFPSANYVGRLM